MGTEENVDWIKVLQMNAITKENFADVTFARIHGLEGKKNLL